MVLVLLSKQGICNSLNTADPVKTVLRSNVTIENCTALNSEHLEFSPAYYQGGIVFVTSQNKKGKQDRKIDEHYFDLFYADLSPEGQPSRPWFFSPNLNSRLHEGPISFGPDYQTIYFTRNNMVNGKPVADSDGDVNLQIYEAEKSPTDWVNLRPLPFNNASYNCAHPTVTPDGNHIYFSSNMPGGYGGMDIYRSDKVNGTWSKPVNLGRSVNTASNEVFPYIHSAGILFFSSDGHGGFGGLDLFMTNKPDRATEISNLGAPFNSVSDDLGFLLDKDGKTGYFASARENGSGKDDIYYFSVPEGLFTKLPFDLMVTVTDASNGKVLNGAAVYQFTGTEDGYLHNTELYDLELAPSGENGELRMTLVRKPDDQLGRPTATTGTSGKVKLGLETNSSYVIYVEKDGYQPQEYPYATFNKSGTSDAITIALQPMDCITMKGLVLNEVTGMGVPGAVIEISANCGQPVQYIYSNLDGQFSYCLPRNCNYTLTATKDGFAKNQVTLSTVGSANKLKTTILLSPLNDQANQPVSKGSVIILDKIYYDFDQSYIRRGAARDLDALVVLMKRYPTMQVEMVAHTDSRGTDDYNMALSERRAQSAQDYVVMRGIAAQRIEAYGVGERNPRNNCTDGVACSETEHQFNRRTEIKVVEIDEPVIFSYRDNAPEVIDRKN